MPQELKISQHDYYVTEVTIPLERLTQEQLIQVINLQQHTIADLKNKTDEDIRNEVKRLRLTNGHLEYQIDKIIGVLSRHGLGGYYEVNAGRNGESPLAGVTLLSQKLFDATNPGK